MKFDVYGREMQVTRTDDSWAVYYTGSEGKRRPAGDIVVPGDLGEEEIGQYLADLCHEWATEDNADVTRVG